MKEWRRQEGKKEAISFFGLFTLDSSGEGDNMWKLV